MSKGRILLVEPDDVREQIEGLFTKYSYTVEAVNNGSVAAKLIQTNPLIDVLILATSIPDIQSSQILRDLQMRDNHPPVVLLSTIVERDSLNLGFFEPHDAITKPFDMEELRLRVEKVLLQTKP